MDVVQIPDFPPLPGIDPFRGLQMSANNQDDYLLILRNFHKNAETAYRRKILDGVSQQDWPAVFHVMHSLFSIAGNIGAERLADLCDQALACKARYGHSESGDEGWKAINTLSNDVLQELDQVLAGLTAAGL